jgi:two-component system chemotaxis response regulator CheY
MRTIIKRSLNSIGITDVTEAADGAQALDQFQSADFDLVLTDWNMPAKTGIELARDIRALGNTTPIFMITTEAEKARVMEAVSAGVNDYLVKPFTADVLKQKLERMAARLDPTHASNATLSTPA